MIDKKRILKELISNLNHELQEATGAAKSGRDLATSPESKSEGKYDTRAIEASYLAGAQLKRVSELKSDIEQLKEIETNETTEENKKIQMGSLVLIEHSGLERYYFLTSTSGGTLLNVEGITILVISVFSPLGNGAIGLIEGESFEVETPKEVRTYKILKIK